MRLGGQRKLIVTYTPRRPSLALMGRRIIARQLRARSNREQHVEADQRAAHAATGMAKYSGENQGHLR